MSQVDESKLICPKLQAAFMSCAAKNYPKESCGFVVSTIKGKYEFIEIKNVSLEPENFFVMDAQGVLDAEDRGDLVAVWHSHTDQSAEPSQADLAGCEASELPWLITAVMKNYDESVEADFHFSSTKLIQPKGFEAPYVGRLYAFGVFDCWTLCRDYLKREFDVSINLNAHLHIPEWYKGDVDILDENYRAEGLVRLEAGEEPRRGDIFFMQFGKMPDHCAIYLGDDQILHHWQGRLSSRAVYGGSYQKHTTHHLRHKDLLLGSEKCLN